ncbi:MAG TPA: glycosyltransferase family 1 protein [Blastocatellia bacterium]|nr:glycosyltransferase family 1 protein [Blastocatellia bacterium]
MRIGVDATSRQNNRGYGRHARALLNALIRLDCENRYTLFVDSVDAGDKMPPEAEVRLVRANAPTAVATAANGHRSAMDMLRMSRAMSDSSFDLLLFPTVYSYVPVFSRAKKIVMIHDVIAETYPQLTLPSFTSRMFWKGKVALGRWQADAIVTVSDYSRQGILDYFKTSPERVFIVGEASDPVFRVLPNPQPTERLLNLGINGTDRTVVYVGGFSPHKNLEALVAAFAKVVEHPSFSDVKLVMVGEYQKEVFHSCYTGIKQLTAELGIASRVVFTGYLPDEELVVLLNLASVLVLPSLIEGFGLPAVEAAACGCPVIATTASPLPGLLGEGGIFINPSNQEELDVALTRILDSEPLRQQMRAAGLAAAAKLTWDAAAQQMIGLILQVAA